MKTSFQLHHLIFSLLITYLLIQLQAVSSVQFAYKARKNFKYAATHHRRKNFLVISEIIRDLNKFSVTSLTFGLPLHVRLTSKLIQYLFVDNFQVRKNRRKLVIVIHYLFKIQNLVLSVLLFGRGRLRNVPEFITHVLHAQNHRITQQHMVQIAFLSVVFTSDASISEAQVQTQFLFHRETALTQA